MESINAFGVATATWAFDILTMVLIASTTAMFVLAVSTRSRLLGVSSAALLLAVGDVTRISKFVSQGARQIWMELPVTDEKEHLFFVIYQMTEIEVSQILLAIAIGVLIGIYAKEDAKAAK